MASSLDIAPALGHGLLTAQGQPGGYDAVDDRRFWSVGRQEGALYASAYKVTQKAEGANLSVDVATDQGHFLVEGDDVLWQGLYLVPATAAKTNLDLADAPDPSLPRVDQVVLEAIDDAHAFGGVTRARVYVLSGTPTAGANTVGSVAYESSKAALPDSTARLAEFVVGAAATSITNANIRDRRSWATGAFARMIRTSGDVNAPAAAPSGATAIGTDLQPRIECVGNPLEVTLRGHRVHTLAGNTVSYRFYVDGVPLDASDLGYTENVATPNIDTGFIYRAIITPPAGSRVIAPYHYTGNTTGTTKANTGRPLEMTVRELVGVGHHNS